MGKRYVRLFSFLLAFYSAGAPAALSQHEAATADELKIVVKANETDFEIRRKEFAEWLKKAVSAEPRRAAGRQSSAGERQPAVKRTAAVGKKRSPAGAGGDGVKTVAVAKDAASATGNARLDVMDGKAGPEKTNGKPERRAPEASEEAGGAERRLTKEEVKNLAEDLGLLDQPKMNPQLTFTDEDASDLRRRRSDDTELKQELAARKVALDAADRQGVVIGDRATLSRVITRILFVMVPQKNEPPTPAREVKRTTAPPIPPTDILVCGGDPADTSADFIQKAWAALSGFKGGRREEVDKYAAKVLACTKVVIETWTPQADEQEAARLQAGECKTNPGVEGKDAYFRSYWALSDVSAAWFIRGQFYSHQQNLAEASKAYKSIIASYPCGYIWDPRGWFWRAAEGAEKELRRIDASL
jgi:hypothetical protein